MAKLLKYAIIGCGIMFAGMIAYDGLQIMKQRNSAGRQVQEAMTIIPIGSYINWASQSLKEGLKPQSLYYLKAILGKETEFQQDVTLEQVAEVTEKVITKYLKKDYFRSIRDDLLELAETLYEEQQVEIAKNRLKEGLENEYMGDKAFSYHVWMVYNLSFRENHSITKTHKDLRDYYKKKSILKYIFLDQLLEEIEINLPKGDSELIKNIRDYN